MTFVQVENARFHIDHTRYRFVGVNYWQAMHLGAFDPSRLVDELDQLSALGLRNVRVLAAFEGPDDAPFRVTPSLRKAPDVWDERLLVGLDRVLEELALRDMRAVVCLSNFWFWSGGLPQLVAWETGEAIPYPIDASLNPYEDGWTRVAEYAARGYRHADRYFQLVERAVGRTSARTGLPYRDDPTIMAWQLCNEPRGAGRRDDMLAWRDETLRRIRRLDDRHLVSLGSEGSTADPALAGLDFAADLAGLDYATIHVWPQNWGWYDGTETTFDAALAASIEYLRAHAAVAAEFGVPIVLEETGLARDGGSFEAAAPTTLRDRFFTEVIGEAERLGFAGINAWSYAGFGRPRAPGSRWRPGDPWSGDPPHEPQGWYSIYDDDSTLSVLAEAAERLAGT